MNPVQRCAPSPSQGDPASSPAKPVLRGVLDERVQTLVGFYRRVQAERMQGIAILNPALSVEAVGFRLAGVEEAEAGGVLITPWFMSLVRLPLAVWGHGGRVGRKVVHGFGNERFEFIGAHDAAVGFHEACALFSPMGDFCSQDQARETAEAVLAELRATPAPASTPSPGPAPAPEPVPARRAFFMARRTAPAQPRP